MVKPTEFQQVVWDVLREDTGERSRSVLLIAPTGLGKTLAVTGDIEQSGRKLIYSVPLRALGASILRDIPKRTRNGRSIHSVIHYGDARGSQLFSEDVVVTT